MATIHKTEQSGPLTFRNAPRESRAGEPYIVPEAADRLIDAMIDEYSELLDRLSTQ